jgi:MarR family transcriptional regulator, lower aerobic nicotinate degradation pathway regulator
MGDRRARDQQLSTVDALAQLSFLVHGMLERRVGEHGASMVQTRLLGVLRDRRPTMHELAKLLDLDKSSVTGLVDRAQARGLVERTPCTEDRRATIVLLTEEGRTLISAVAAGFEGDVARLLAQLPGSDRQALSLLVSRLLVAHARAHGVDLFATTVDRDLAPARAAADTRPR